MKVLIVTDYGTAAGGAERMTMLLRDGLRERGHQARVLVSTARPSPGPIDAEYLAFGTTSRLRAWCRPPTPGRPARFAARSGISSRTWCTFACS